MDIWSFYLVVVLIFLSMSILCAVILKINPIKYRIVAWRIRFVFAIVVIFACIIWLVVSANASISFLQQHSFTGNISRIAVFISPLLFILQPIIQKNECGFCGKRVYLRALFSNHCPHCHELLYEDRFTRKKK